jgi:O-antigen/teichoic acid export membrane protein
VNITDKLFSIFIRDVVLFVTTLLTGVVIARYLGPEKMGIWTLLLLIPGYAEAFGRLQLDVSSVYFIGKRKIKLGEAAFILHSVSVIMVAVIALVGFLNIDFLHNQIFKNVEMDVREFIYGVFLIVPLRFIYINYSYLLIAREKVKAYNKLIIIQALTTSILSIGMIVLLDFGILGALIGSILGLLISIIYGISKVNSIDKIRPNFNTSLIIEMAKYSAHLYINGLVIFFQNNVSTLIAAYYVAPAQIAFFALGKSMSEISTRMVPAAVNTILFPRVSSSNDERGSIDLVIRSFRVTLLLISTTTVILFYLIKPIVFTLYGDDYYPLIDIFVIIIASVVMVQSSSVLMSYLTGSGNVHLLPKLSILPLLLQVILSFFLISDFGIVGIAISYAISSACLFIFHVIFFLKLTDTKIESLFIRYEDFKTVKNFLVTKLKTLLK